MDLGLDLTFRFSFQFPLVFSAVEFIFIKCFHFLYDFCWYFVTVYAVLLQLHSVLLVRCLVHLSFEELFVHISSFCTHMDVGFSLWTMSANLFFVLYFRRQHLRSHSKSSYDPVLIFTITTKFCVCIFGSFVSFYLLLCLLQPVCGLITLCLIISTLFYQVLS